MADRKSDGFTGCQTSDLADASCSEGIMQGSGSAAKTDFYRDGKRKSRFRKNTFQKENADRFI